MSIKINGTIIQPKYTGGKYMQCGGQKYELTTDSNLCIHRPRFVIRNGGTTWYIRDIWMSKIKIHLGYWAPKDFDGDEGISRMVCKDASGNYLGDMPTRNGFVMGPYNPNDYYNNLNGWTNYPGSDKLKPLKYIEKEIGIPSNLAAKLWRTKRIECYVRLNTYSAGGANFRMWFWTGSSWFECVNVSNSFRTDNSVQVKAYNINNPWC